MANQQQHQNPQRPGTDREWNQQPPPSPGQTRLRWRVGQRLKPGPDEGWSAARLATAAAGH